MKLIFALLVVGAMVGLTFYYWRCARPEIAPGGGDRWLLIWLGKGLLAPMLIWTALNLGWPFEPLLPSITRAAQLGTWAETFLSITAGVLWLVGTHWTAVTMGWFTWDVFQRTREKRAEFLGVAFLWLFPAVPMAALLVWMTGAESIALVVALWCGAVIHGTSWLLPVETAPTYSRALAKLNFDRYNEAEWEIIRQLEKCENDFNGWLLLADLYATRFRDLPAAEKVVSDLCDDPAMTPPEVCIALNKLADWELAVGDDPIAARKILQRIGQRYPDTHMARMAQLRLEDLPQSREELCQRRQPRRVRLPGSAEAAANPARESDSPEAVARRLVEQLKENPDDAAAREQFARVMALSLGQVEIGLEQLQLLLGLPHQPPARRAEWIALMAEWQLTRRKDRRAGESLLRQLVRDYPQTPHGFQARARLQLLAVEEQMRRRREPPSGVED